MIKKSKRLQPVANLAGTRERDAARALGDAQRILKEHEERLGELLDYQAQYRQQFHDAGSAGFAAQRLNDYQAFLTRLKEGIRHQTTRIQLARLTVEKRKGEWMEARSRAQAMNKVVERHVSHEKYHEDRQDQLETDEQARVVTNGRHDPLPD